ncbi:MAG: protoporphyrinogen oxidase [Actinomycetota bacterium]|jgi:oxygen-dependent protoporphyrinogen oxidase|nr:protoporphyrinogen oxidase [Actinomycetota bacterium]
MKQVIIIGGGVAGLGAAYKLRRAADESHDIEFTLVEKADRLGGKLATDRVTDSQGAEYVIDGGSDSFLTQKTAVHRVARMLGIIDEECSTLDDNKKTLIVKNGGLVELPDGIMMFAPTKIVPMVTTSLYSWPAKFRMAMDLVIPRKEIVPGELNDESLEDFVVRRMGRECLDRLAEPLVGGVNGSDPGKMSLAATYPNLLEMEQEHGSLVRGFLATRKKVEEMKRKHPPKPGTRPRTFFTSFNEGLQFPTDRMADAAGRDRMRTGTAAIAVRREDDGSWSVELADGGVLSADAVIMASEVWASERLMRGVDETLADLLEQIPSTSSATVAIAFDIADCPFDLKWHGILSPRIERQTVTGVSLVSSKWPNRAPDGTVLLRAFVGGPHNQAVLDMSDDEITDIVVRQLVDLIGVKDGARPRFARVYRWENGMPQYTMGHLSRVEEIETLTAEIPGLALAGGGLRGVGVPNCLESGEAAASKVMAEWGVHLAEDTATEKRVY